MGRGLGWGTQRGPCPPPPFCDSVKPAAHLCSLRNHLRRPPPQNQQQSNERIAPSARLEVPPRLTCHTLQRRPSATATFPTLLGVGRGDGPAPCLRPPRGSRELPSQRRRKEPAPALTKTETKTTPQSSARQAPRAGEPLLCSQGTRKTQTQVNASGTRDSPRQEPMPSTGFFSAAVEG